MEKYGVDLSALPPTKEELELLKSLNKTASNREEALEILEKEGEDKNGRIRKV